MIDQNDTTLRPGAQNIALEQGARMFNLRAEPARGGGVILWIIGAAAATAVALVASVALGQERANIGRNAGAHHTYVELGPPTRGDAVATLAFRNIGVNNGRDEGQYTVEWNGLDVIVFFDWDADGSSDQIEVTPPQGYRADPPLLALPEESAGEVQIIEWQGT